jgi:glucose-1-phosphatase
MALENIKVVVFDLGGVLLQLRNPIRTFGLDMTEATFLERWLKSPGVREFERGAVDAETFARSMVAELELDVRWQEFLRRFDSWPERIFPEAMALVDAVPAGIGRALLSNINASHWGRTDIAGALEGHFDRMFLSFRTGFLKPDPQAFAQVATAFGLPAETLLFFDDNPLNVSAAIESGMQAFICNGPSDARHVLGQL